MKKITLTLLMAISVFSFAQLSGQYSVGTSPSNYATISDAVTDLNNQGISGNVTFMIKAGVYNEQFEINDFFRLNEAYTVTFSSATGVAEDVTINYEPTSTNDNYTILLNGCKNVFFRRLTISTSGTSGYNRVIVFENNPKNIELSFNNIIGSEGDGAEITSKVPLYSANSNDSLINISYNHFDGAVYAFVYLSGVDGLDFIKNDLTTNLTTGDRGMYLINLSGEANISENNVISISQIYTRTGSTNNLLIEKNIFNGSLWLKPIGTSSNPCRVENNLIIDGLINLLDGEYLNLYHNTVYNTNSESCMWIGTPPTNLSIKNNQFIKIGANNNPTIRVNTLDGVNDLDYNNYYSPNEKLFYYDSHYYTNIQEWQDSISFDDNSLNTLPYFIDADSSDFHLCQINNEYIGEGGLVSYDFDETSRDATNPTIGAFEYTGTHLSTPYLGEDVTTCGDTTIILNAGTYTSYLWNTLETSGSIIVDTTGEYIVYVTDETACEANDNIIITLNPEPNVFLGNDTTICEGESIYLNAGTGTSYLWNTGETSQIIIADTTGTYSVEVTNNYGCTGFSNIHINVTACSGISELGETYKVSIYPNPAQNKITISSKNIAINKLEILDITGKTTNVVCHSERREESINIDISNLQNGIYFLKLNNTKTIKFIKE